MRLSSYERKSYYPVLTCSPSDRRDGRHFGGQNGMIEPLPLPSYEFWQLLVLRQDGLAMYRAHPGGNQAPGLFQKVRELRPGAAAHAPLYQLPEETPIAFATGHPENAVFAVTEGFLAAFDP